MIFCALEGGVNLNLVVCLKMISIHKTKISSISLIIIMIMIIILYLYRAVYFYRYPEALYNELKISHQ